jgi:putative transposase
MPDYRRNPVPSGTCFYTVNLMDRTSDLLIHHIDGLGKAVRDVRRVHPFHIDAWVILPEHTHSIWTLPEGDDDYSSRWKVIKIRFAKQIPKTKKHAHIRLRKGERGIWQRRFWEHTIRS